MAQPQRTRPRTAEHQGTVERKNAIGAKTFWLLAPLGALALRIALVALSPKYGYFPDHDDFVRWGIQATDDGLTSLYVRPPAVHDARVWEGSKWINRQRSLERLCNYPPLSTYLLGASGLVLQAVSPDRLINTYTSRIIFSSWSILADLLTAWGCAALVARFVARPAAARWTFLCVLLAPPIWWDSAIWGQMDALLMAPAVWTVFFMSTGRWKTAGLTYGLAAALKPQAILLLPVWALAFVVTRPIWKPALALLISVGVLMASSLPFLLDSGWAWLRLSYVQNLLDAYAVTTLKAFNFWYLDLLICDSKDALAQWLGVTKDVWGKVLLLAMLAGGFVWMVLRWRRDLRTIWLWTALCLLMFVMLPTRVHERYLVLSLPFLIVLSALWWRFLPATLLLTVVATAQVTWPGWLTTPAGDWSAFETKQSHKYEQWLESLPPSRRNEAPSLQETLAKPRREYLARRSRVLAYEWLFTIMGIVGFLTMIGTCMTIPPSERDTFHGRLDPPVP